MGAAGVGRGYGAEEAGAGGRRISGRTSFQKFSYAVSSAPRIAFHDFRPPTGHEDEGEELYHRTLEEKPGFRWAEGSWIYLDLVKGRPDRARRRADRMVDRESAVRR